MWANEDGIPLLGSFAHFNEFHTDPAYENLVLSLASGAIGNSEMPVIDIYGGPLGWIPVFNPSHVKGHGTDYVTLLTSCGGIGIPLNSNDLTTLNVPSVEKLADLSDLILPGLPSPEKLTDPNYLWKTTDATDILHRISPETLSNMDEYVNFAGDHFDTWRLLWETALSDVSSGNPTGILEVLKITENINTLESLSSVVGGTGSTPGSPAGGLLPGVLGEEGLTSVVGGLTGGLTGGGSTPTPGTPGTPTPGTGGLTDGLSGLLGGNLLGSLPILGGGGTTTPPTTPPVTTTSEFTVLMSGATHTPPVTSDGLGQCQAKLSGNTLTVACLYANMSSNVTGAHLHSGSTSFDLTTTGGTSGGATGTFTLTSEQATALKAGQFSLNIHTTNHANGEIGGTVKPC